MAETDTMALFTGDTGHRSVRSKPTLLDSRIDGDSASTASSHRAPLHRQRQRQRQAPCFAAGDPHSRRSSSITLSTAHMDVFRSRRPSQQQQGICVDYTTSTANMDGCPLSLSSEANGSRSPSSPTKSARRISEGQHQQLNSLSSSHLPSS
jgi:hypothetical protein